MIADKFTTIFLNHPAPSKDRQGFFSRIAEIYSEPFSVNRADDVFEDFLFMADINDLKVKSNGNGDICVTVLDDISLVNPTIEDIAMTFLFNGERPLTFEPNLVKRNFVEL